MNIKWMQGKSESSILFSVDIEITSDHLADQTLEWSTPYIMGINMLNIYKDAVYQQRHVWAEESPTSIKFLEPDYLRVGDIITIEYKVSNVSMGDLRIVPTYADLSGIRAVYNQVALVTTQKKFYKFDGEGWEPFIIPFTTQNIGLLFAYEKQFILDHTERTFELENIHYEMGTGNMLVFIDGQKVDPEDYEEIDNKTITFLEDLDVGAGYIEFVVASSDPWDETYDHTVDYLYDSNDNIIQEVVKQNGTEVKRTVFEYDDNDNIVKSIVTRGAKTIIKVFTYDINDNIVNVDVTISSTL